MFNNIKEILKDLETTKEFYLLSAKVQAVYNYPIFKKYSLYQLENDNAKRFQEVVAKLLTFATDLKLDDIEKFTEQQKQSKIQIDKFNHKVKESKWLDNYEEK